MHAQFGGVLWAIYLLSVCVGSSSTPALRMLPGILGKPWLSAQAPEILPERVGLVR